MHTSIAVRLIQPRTADPGDTEGVIVMLAALVAVLSVPVALTWLGQRRRGSGRGVAAVAAVFFPVAWTVWYVADERPYTA